MAFMTETNVNFLFLLDIFTPPKKSGLMLHCLGYFKVSRIKSWWKCNQRYISQEYHLLSDAVCFNYYLIKVYILHCARSPSNIYLITWNSGQKLKKVTTRHGVIYIESSPPTLFASLKSSSPLYGGVFGVYHLKEESSVGLEFYFIAQRCTLL